MSVSTVIAIYFLVWWVTLFAVLPWGVRNQEESGNVAPGTDPGAPSTPKLRQKLLWTTLVSAALFALVAVIYGHRVALIDALAALLGVTR